MTDIVYKYKPKPLRSLLAGGFFVLCLFPIVNTAINNDRGLTINHTVTLTTDQATLFFWFLTAACVFLTLAGLIGFVKGITSSAVIRLTDSGIILPMGFFISRNLTIAYKDIRDLTTQDINGQVFLTIHHTKGKISIAQSMMETKGKFEEVGQQLAARIAAHRAATT